MTLRRVAPEHEFVELNQGREVVMRTDRRLRWQQWDVPRRAQVARADLLHVPGFDAPLWKPLPVVLTVHDLIGKLSPQNLPPVSRFYWSLWLPFTLRFADAVIVDSERTRQDVMRFTGLPAERIEVIHLGVDEGFRPRATEEVEACRARYGLPRHVILYVGTLEPRKGVDTLIEAFVEMADRHPHSLVLAGKRGWYWEPILQRVAAKGLEDRVRFLDYVAEEDLPSLYASATVLALPSRYEGFGLPVLEAMACGTPVVCSNAGALPEVVGEAALLVPPDRPRDLAEALEAVLDDAGLRDSLRDKGLQRAGQFTWERTARATLGAYQKLLAAR